MVEHVEHIHAELEVEPFFNRYFTLQSEIENDQTGVVEPVYAEFL